MQEIILLGLCCVGSISWISILLLPWRPWDTKEQIEANPDITEDISEVTVLIPARDEEEAIGQTMTALNAQGRNLKIILIDDQSSDRTASVARETSTQNLSIISGVELEEGWAGKLWALEQGRKRVDSPYILLIDADIELAPATLATLLHKLKTENLDLVSIMAELRMHTFWEKLLIPSFIYFFKLLYPFSVGNSARTKLGVAAGGCILVRKSALDGIGGFGALKNALIDDCTLAQKIKSSGKLTWIGLSRSVKSHRGYGELKPLWNMVARSAFTQLKYSNLILIGCTLVMAAMFWFTVIAVFSDIAWVRVLGAIGLYCMIKSYMPTLYFYRRSPLWAFAMPLIGTLYLAMTWTSAIRYWRGKRSEWKGRIYKKAA